MSFEFIKFIILLVLTSNYSFVSAMTGVTTARKNVSIAVYWFRNALRLHDNPSLLHACQLDKLHKDDHVDHYLCPIFIIDPKCPFAQTKDRRVGPVRANFVLESLHDLNRNLGKLDGGGKSSSRLLVLRGSPVDVLPELFSTLMNQQDISIPSANTSFHLIYEKENALPVREMDAAVIKKLKKKIDVNHPQHSDKLEILSFDTHSLFEMEHYVAKCKGGVAPSTMGSFRKIFSSMGDVPDEVDPVTSCPSLYPAFEQVVSSSLSFSSSSKSLFTIPSLNDLGYDVNEIWRGDPNCTFVGGEEEAMKLLQKMKRRPAWVATFEKPKTKPNALVPDTTGLSAYVKHGCLSARRFYHALSEIYEQIPTHSQPPVSLHGQLLWREFNYLHGYTTPNFDKMRDNPVARQIPWDDDPRLLQAWKSGQTGFPFIDAIAVQLEKTGWIHHLARHAVACFLTRGDLWISWEEGAAVFEERLIDADWAINNFNWQWLSCTAHFYQYFRCYSPVAFGKKTDPNGDYIRKWLPQFKNYPKKYIFEPWKAPLNIQKSCGVVIGKDYPEPIVDHTTISKSNMERMKGKVLV